MTADNEILELLKAKDEKGLELMMHTYMGLVYTLVHNKIASICTREDIEECASDVFYEVYKNSERIDLEKGSLKAFLAVVAKRKAIDIYRKHYRKIGHVISLEMFQESEFMDSDSDHESNLYKKEEKEAMISAIKSLGEPDSELLIRRYFFEQPSREVGEAMDMKVNTVDKRISRALVKLKKVWEKIRIKDCSL